MTAGRRQGVTRQQFLAFAHASRSRNQGARPRRRSSACGARSISGSGRGPSAPVGFCCATSPVVAGEVPTMNAKTSRAALARGQCTGQHCKADPAEVRPTPFTQFLNLSVGKAKGRRKKKIIWCRYADSGRISTPRRRSENSGRANARFMGKGNPTARCHRVAAIGRAPSK